MLVVDTSAVVEVLAASALNPALAQRLADDDDLQAPHLIDVEILHTLRRLTFIKKLSSQLADHVRADYRDLAISRFPLFPSATGSGSCATT